MKPFLIIYQKQTTQRNFSDLLLVAASIFLGEQRNHLSEQISKKIIYELDKNLSHHSTEDIRSHLPKFLTH